MKAKTKEEVLSDIIINEGYSLVYNEYTIESCGNSYEYNGDKQFVVTNPYKKVRGFNTVLGAMKYIDNQ